MKVYQLKELLDRVHDTDALVCIGHADDNFYDGEVMTGMMIQHNFEDGKESVKVTLVGDGTIAPEYN